MKIEKLIVKNFRSYNEKTEILFDNLNVLLGKNDVGKSTILEALDIFFNDGKKGKSCVSIGLDDINKGSGDDTIEISVCFSEIEDEIIIDTIPTKVSEEFLLNEEGYLQIKKVYSGAAMKASTFLTVNHPSNDDIIGSLLTTKITDLKKYCTDNGITVSDNRVSSIIRKSIRDSYQKLEFKQKEIAVDKEGAKEIWGSISKQLPTYILFQSDRSNSDQDNEIQNPMNIALNNILGKAEILDKLQEVFDEVEKEMNEVAIGTLGELKNINPDLANVLTPKLPEFEKLGWNKAFSKTEITSDNIPLNKRGSGVKRMVLLSFFMNEVKRRKTEEGLNDIIYAFEEPETSQHPQHQEVLINAFSELSKDNGCQVILTTHSPYVYKQLTFTTDTNLMHISDNAIGEKVIENIFSEFNLFPHSPSWGEINYYVYGLSTFEFYDELYSRIEEIKPKADHVDDYIVANSSIRKDIRWKHANDDGTQMFRKDGKTVVEYDSTYITCVRHQIHHPNNKLNADFLCKLDDGIEAMINLIK